MDPHSHKLYQTQEPPKVMMQHPSSGRMSMDQHINMYLERARMNERLKNTKDAIMDYRYILLLDPGNMSAKIALDYLLIEQFLI
jgi:hypothetical protein